MKSLRANMSPPVDRRSKHARNSPQVRPSHSSNKQNLHERALSACPEHWGPLSLILEASAPSGRPRSSHYNTRRHTWNSAPTLTDCVPLARRQEGRGRTTLRGSKINLHLPTMPECNYACAQTCRTSRHGQDFPSERKLQQACSTLSSHPRNLPRGRNIHLHS